MWAGVLFFLFSVGSVFYVFEHLNIWIQKDETENLITETPPVVSTASVHVAMDENRFLSSKFIFKKVCTIYSMLLSQRHTQFHCALNIFMCSVASNAQKTSSTASAIASSTRTRCSWLCHCHDYHRNGPSDC